MAMSESAPVSHEIAIRGSVTRLVVAGEGKWQVARGERQYDVGGLSYDTAGSGVNAVIRNFNTNRIWRSSHAIARARALTCRIGFWRGRFFGFVAGSGLFCRIVVRGPAHVCAT